MKKFNLFWVSCLFLLVLLPSVFALNVTEAHGVALTGGSSVTETKGLAFTVNYNVLGLNITQHPSGTATRAYIANSSHPTTPIATATFSGNNAVFTFGSVNLTAGAKYYFQVDSSGSSYTSYNEGGSSINNQVGTFGNWTGCYYGGAIRATPCVAVNVVSIVLSNDTYSTPVLLPSISFTGQTPINASTLYELTNQAYNLTATNAGIGAWVLSFYNSSGSLINSYCTGNNSLGCSSAFPPTTRLGQPSETLGVSFNFNNVSYGTEDRSHPAGIYYYNATFTNASGWTNYTETRQINVTDWNAYINISAINAINSAAISNFSGWIYVSETGLNNTFNTTTGSVLTQTVSGNITAFIDAEGFSLNSNHTLKGFNISVGAFNVYNYTFNLYETNTLNITFYDQATPTVILSGISIGLDLISSLYANNYTTTNGTMYLTLLTPEDYTLRYYATGYSERFYTLTLTNRSFQNIKLYLINNSVTTNLTINVVDEITNPVEGAEVYIYKYNLPSNTYILQQILTTGNDGSAIGTVTFNDEYYKFSVVYQGEVKLTTLPEYITTTSKTLQISTGNSFGQEYFDYFNFWKDLTFNTATDNFRLEYLDMAGINSQVCLRVSRLGNFTSTEISDTCQTGASGTILASVTPINGTTYQAYAYFLSNSIEYFLDSESYTYASSNIFEDQGLFYQWILTGAFIFIMVFIGWEFAILSIPISLWVGNYLTLNQFSNTGLYAVTTACLIIFFIAIVNKRGRA